MHFSDCTITLTIHIFAAVLNRQTVMISISYKSVPFKLMSKALMISQLLMLITLAPYEITRQLILKPTAHQEFVFGIV
jgi:hypothetical protein